MIGCIVSLWGGRVPRLLAVVAITGVLALAASPTAPARAAGPTLTPSENPVVIPEPATTETISLTWNLNGLPRADINVWESGGPTVYGPATATVQIGAFNLTVTLGKTYIAEMRNTSNQVLFSLAITTKRPLMLNPGVLGPLIACAVQVCINNVAVTPHGTYVDIVPTTNKPAKFLVEASTSPPDANGAFASVASSMFTFGSSTTWQGKLFNLQPNTTYHYVLRATGQDNTVARKTGTFTTLKRKVLVTFARIDLIDDSDAFSDCDCLFVFVSGPLGPTYYGDVDNGIPSGTTLLPFVQFTHTNAPASLMLWTQGYDEDCDIGEFCFCGTNPGPPPWYGGEGDCAEWGVASRTIDASPLAPGNEAYTEAFEMTTPSNHPVRFKVTGTFQVSYVP